MALNVNALVSTSAWPLTPWEAVGCVRDDSETSLTPPKATDNDSLSAVGQDGNASEKTLDTKDSKKLLMKLLDVY